MNEPNTICWRPASVLVCVMVVLLLVGMLSSQTIQTLMIVRKSDSQRKVLRQARELVELGRMVASTLNDEKTPFRTSLQVDRNTTGGIVISRTRNQTTDAAGATYRIVASYPSESDHQMTASWEGIP